MLEILQEAEYAGVQSSYCPYDSCRIYSPRKRLGSDNGAFLFYFIFFKKKVPYIVSKHTVCCTDSERANRILPVNNIIADSPVYVSICGMYSGNDGIVESILRDRECVVLVVKVRIIIVDILKG